MTLDLTYAPYEPHIGCDAISVGICVVSVPCLWAVEHIVTVIAAVQICLAHH